MLQNELGNFYSRELYPFLIHHPPLKRQNIPSLSSRSINLEARELPIRIVVHTTWLGADIIDTSSSTSTLRIERLSRTCPVATNVDIRNDALVPEMAADIAIGTWKICQCLTPSARVWRSRCYIGR